jgi:hypothetical protein
MAASNFNEPGSVPVFVVGYETLEQFFVSIPMISFSSEYSAYVKFEVFAAVTMKNVVFWDIKIPVRASQETHYVSATEPSQLSLHKI